MEIINIIKDFGSNFKGNIRITIDTHTINEKSWHVIRWIDNGIGHQPEDMPLRQRLRFEETKRAILSLGGTFEYSSRYAEGSTTIIKIPSQLISLDLLRQSLNKGLKRMQYGKPGASLDILLLGDDWRCAETFQQGFNALDKGLLIDFTVSHKYGLKLLATSSPKLFIVQPNFYGFNLERGKEYIRFVKETLPQQRIALLLNSSLDDRDRDFFNRLGISLSIKNNLLFKELKENYPAIAREIRSTSEINAPPESALQTLLADLPDDYGNLARLERLLQESLLLIKDLATDTTFIKDTYAKRQNESEVRNLAKDIATKLEKSMDLFEETLIILFRNYPHEQAHNFETFYQLYMIHPTTSIRNLIKDRFLPGQVDSAYSFSMHAYKELLEAFRVLIESLPSGCTQGEVS